MSDQPKDIQMVFNPILFVNEYDNKRKTINNQYYKQNNINKRLFICG